MNTIKKRWNAKTPVFWKRVQTIGLSLAGISSVILTAPVSLPIGIVTLAGYLATVSYTHLTLPTTPYV